MTWHRFPALRGSSFIPGRRGPPAFVAPETNRRLWRTFDLYQRAPRFRHPYFVSREGDARRVRIEEGVRGPASNGRGPGLGSEVANDTG